MWRVTEIISEVKALAKEYYALTGKPLGITVEIAEVEAARLLEMVFRGISPLLGGGY